MVTNLSDLASLSHITKIHMPCRDSSTRYLFLRYFTPLFLVLSYMHPITCLPTNPAQREEKKIPKQSVQQALLPTTSPLLLALHHQQSSVRPSHPAPTNRASSGRKPPRCNLPHPLEEMQPHLTELELGLEAVAAGEGWGLRCGFTC